MVPLLLMPASVHLLERVWAFTPGAAASWAGGGDDLRARRKEERREWTDEAGAAGHCSGHWKPDQSLFQE